MIVNIVDRSYYKNKLAPDASILGVDFASSVHIVSSMAFSAWRNVPMGFLPLTLDTTRTEDFAASFVALRDGDVVSHQVGGAENGDLPAGRRADEEVGQGEHS
jgi:hypothetical protein